MSNKLVSLPLCALNRSKVNVRKTEKSVALNELAASIASKGLLENLIVRPKDEGTYDVIAGGRRLQALRLLAKRKTIAPDHPVACLVLESSEPSDLTEISLAENTVRAQLHPADQFEAFAKLQAQGLSIEDIAARFGLSTTVVRQRLKLACVSPKLIGEYRKGAMDLDQLMAFAITDDHTAQEEVWGQIGLSDPSSQSIKRLLTKSLVEGSDRRALFIGAKAYEKAGGTILRDLFDDEGEGYFTDSQLLDRLVREKLEREADKLHPEGWSWVEVRPENEYVDLSAYGRIRMIDVPLAEEGEARLRVLSERYDQLVASLEDEGNAELEKELDKVSDELEALQDKREAWPEDDKKIAGAVITLDYSGCPQIARGLVRPDDKRKMKKSAGENCEEPQGTGANGYADSLVLELSAHRTAALQESIAKRPDVALDTLVHLLVLRVFFESHRECCLSITPSVIELGHLSPSLAESRAIAALRKRDSKWRARMPSEEEDLLSWVSSLNRRDKFELLAYCTAVTLDATQRRDNGKEHGDNSGEIATALDFDMAEWWQPTREGFFERLTKAQIMEAVSEACSPEIARSLEGLKKPEMAAKAEALVAGSRWLPKVLRGAIKNVENTQDIAEATSP